MDVNILSAMMDRRRFQNLRHAIPEQMISPETTGMLRWFQAYWSAYPEDQTLNVDNLVSLIRLRAQGQDSNTVGLTLALADALRKPVPEAVIRGINAQLIELDCAGKAGAVLSRYNNGEDVDLSFELMMLARTARNSLADGDKPQWESCPIHEYLEDDTDDGGIILDAIPELGRNIKGLRGGDNIAVAAPTDKGKTSFLCRIAVNSAAQAKQQPDIAGRPLLYLVNEGKGSRIVTRLYQTATRLPRSKMVELARERKLEPLYTAVVGALDAIRVVPIHGKNISQVMRIIEQHKPYAVISDMTGRIRAMSNKTGGMNDIGQLEEVWDGMRELAAIYDFWHLGTIQVSQEGFNMLYPPLSAMQNSKTGIQTTLDLAIMMGALSAPEAAYLRGISTPKNKLARSGCPSENKVQVIFEPEVNEWQ